MKYFKELLAITAIVAIPAACASMSGAVLGETAAEGTALRADEETGVEGLFKEAAAMYPALHLENHADIINAGYAAGLLQENTTDQGGRYSIEHNRSPFTEGAASFLLPGLGQYRMGRTLRSRIYFGLEGASWVAIGSFLWQGYARENAYKEYAVAYANVRGTSHSDEYYEDIGDYRSNEGPGGYNEAVRREARDLYYPDVDAIEAYYEANKIEGELSWRWETERAFMRYNALRDGSSASYRRALYTVFFALALRVVSTVDAVRIARGEASVPKGGNAGRAVSMSLDHQPGGLRICINRSF